jgi:hypothetical protein
MGDLPTRSEFLTTKRTKNLALAGSLFLFAVGTYAFTIHKMKSDIIEFDLKVQQAKNQENQKLKSA